MMPRAMAWLWAVLIVVSAVGLYMVKYRVQAIQAEIAEVSQQLEQEREGLHVVSAEWAYLTRPDRLQELSERHLNLQPLSSRQIADVTDVPEQNSLLAAVSGATIPASAQQPAEGE